MSRRGSLARTSEIQAGRRSRTSYASSPPAGIAAQDISRVPLALTSDGSIIVSNPEWQGQYGTTTATTTFYAWKAGEPAWRQLAPPVDTMSLLAYTPAGPAGPAALWAMSLEPTVVRRYVLP